MKRERKKERNSNCFCRRGVGVGRGGLFHGQRTVPCFAVRELLYGQRTILRMPCRAVEIRLHDDRIIVDLSVQWGRDG